jgi:hypothetical protein
VRSLAALLAGAFGLGGCAAPVVIASAGTSALQAGTSAYINGELDSAQIAPMATVYAAALDALSDLQFPLSSSRMISSRAGINAQEVNGRSIRIELTAKSPVVTKINIRVGLVGDQAVSRLLLAEIQARCPAVPTPSPPDEPPPKPPPPKATPDGPGP